MYTITKFVSGLIDDTCNLADSLAYAVGVIDLWVVILDASVPDVTRRQIDVLKHRTGDCRWRRVVFFLV